jgi:hypothetical protein
MFASYRSSRFLRGIYLGDAVDKLENGAPSANRIGRVVESQIENSTKDAAKESGLDVAKNLAADHP